MAQQRKNPKEINGALGQKGRSVAMTTDRVREILEEYLPSPGGKYDEYSYKDKEREITEASTAIRAAIADELDGVKKPIPGKTYLPYKFAKVWNNAITDCQERIRKGGGQR